jgi:hypothetical protein
MIVISLAMLFSIVCSVLLYIGIQRQHNHTNDSKIRERLSQHMMLEDYRAVKSYTILYSNYFTKQELYALEKWVDEQEINSKRSTF